MTKITVVIATHNGERFLRELLGSIASQTLRPDEIVISDDGSSDGTVGLIEEFIAASELDIRFIRNTTSLGYADNFLSACAKSRGDIICFCDQDDIWLPEKLAVVSEALADDNVMLCAHRAILVDSHGDEIGVFDQGISERRLVGPLGLDLMNIYCGFSMAFRRKVLELLPFADRPVNPINSYAKFGHDRWVYTLVNLVGSTLELPDRLVRYRQHSMNVFGAYRSRATTAAVITSRERRHQFISHLETNNALYTQYIAEIYSLLDRLPDRVMSFDRDRSILLLSAYRDQLSAVGEIYACHSIIEAISRYIKCLSSNVYYDIRTGSLRYRAVLRDAIYLILRAYYRR